MRHQDTVIASATKFLGRVSLESIDEDLMAIKTQVYRQYKIFTENELRVLVDEQLQKLQRKLQVLVEDGNIARGKANFIISELRSKQKCAIKRAIKIPIKNDHLPLLPIIPRAILNEALQMNILRGREDGSAFMFRSLERIDDVFEIPPRCYWSVDVDDGKEHFRYLRSPGESVMRLMEKRRFGQTAAEVIALGVHTDVLSEHNLYALYSRDGNGDVPKLISSYPDNVPILTSTSISMGNTDCGSPSCADRVG